MKKINRSKSTPLSIFTNTTQIIKKKILKTSLSLPLPLLKNKKNIDKIIQFIEIESDIEELPENIIIL